jgi:hypothetical protein
MPPIDRRQARSCKPRSLGERSISAKIMVWRFDGRMALSRRDRLIVARHEVPGSQEWPEPVPQLRVQHRGTLFGAENTMNILKEQKVLAMADYILAFPNAKTLLY